MHRPLVIVLSCLALVTLAVAPGLTGVPAPEGATIIQVPEGVKAKNPAVKFEHTRHAAVECTVCHHTWDGASPVKQCADAGCHDDFKSKKSDHSYYRAFHAQGERSCLGCHKTMKKAGQKAGFTSCGKGKTCHVGA